MPDAPRRFKILGRPFRWISEVLRPDNAPYLSQIDLEVKPTLDIFGTDDLSAVKEESFGSSTTTGNDYFILSSPSPDGYYRKIIGVYTGFDVTLGTAEVVHWGIHKSGRYLAMAGSVDNDLNANEGAQVIIPQGVIVPPGWDTYLMVGAGLAAKSVAVRTVFTEMRVGEYSQW